MSLFWLKNLSWLPMASRIKPKLLSKADTALVIWLTEPQPFLFLELLLIVPYGCHPVSYHKPWQTLSPHPHPAPSCEVAPDSSHPLSTCIFSCLYHILVLLSWLAFFFLSRQKASSLTTGPRVLFISLSPMPDTLQGLDKCVWSKRVNE